jgi:hypothetical protein
MTVQKSVWCGMACVDWLSDTLNLGPLMKGKNVIVKLNTEQIFIFIYYPNS